MQMSFEFYFYILKNTVPLVRLLIIHVDVLIQNFLLSFYSTHAKYVNWPTNFYCSLVQSIPVLIAIKEEEFIREQTIKNNLQIKT